MELTSPHFKHNGSIPREFTCQGKDLSPALEIQGIPDGTVSLALIVDDPDAPMGMWVHWVVYDIDPRNEIKSGEIPGVQGTNDFRRLDYGGPCPPSGRHRYFFKLYALDVKLNLEPGRTKEQVLQAMQGHILDQAELIGLYQKK